MGEEGVLLGECKWTTRPLGVNILEELQRKAQVMGVDGSVRYALFARAGFTDALARRAGEEGVELIGLEELTQV